MRNQSQVRTLLRAVGVDGWSDPINVAPYRHIVIIISSENSGDGTIKIAGSCLSGAEVDFESTAGVDNEWDYILGYNYQDAVGVNGDTGVVYSGTDKVEQILVNTDHINTLAVELSGYSAGNFTVKFIGANDTKE